MKVTLWMAMSVNGIIARENNEEDFISHDNWLAWLEAMRADSVRNIIWGRKTHEIVKTWPKEYFDDLKGTRVLIVSSNPNYDVGDGFELVATPREALERLEKDGVKEVLVTGGSTINSSFAKLGLINEVVLNIEPVIVGKGIPLFSPDLFDMKLELIEMKPSKGKTIQLRFKVI